ncbi:MAG: DNA polymerase III subunit gamma/tau [Bacteroidetes bacterium]|nr:DNA polymerase III subunit gamma/tau [Bacteroidota bacterium]
MENFVVSARKYRPVKFEEVVGQSQVTTTLKNAIKNNSLGQSFLFTGPRGVGKTTCARILAKTINCENITSTHEACGECASCKAFKQSSSFNIFELDAASNSHVDDIRQLTEQVRYAPQTGKYKIYIIDEVHMLSASAFNAFLKTLEEPPPYAIFILATTEKHKIIPTILSRCQIYDFARIKNDDIVKHLQMICQKENLEADEDGLLIIANKADGALRDALSILDRLSSFTEGKLTLAGILENLHILDQEYYFSILDACMKHDQSQVMLTFNDILQKGFEGDDFLSGLGEHCRNLLVCKDESTIDLVETSDTLKEKYLNQSANISSSFLLSALHVINHCDIGYKISKNKRLHVEMCLFKLCFLNQVIEVGPIEDQEETKKKPAESTSSEITDTPNIQTVSADQTPIAEEKPSQPDHQPEKTDSINAETNEADPGTKSQTKENENNDEGSVKLMSLEEIKNKVSTEKEKQETETGEQPKEETHKISASLDDLLKAWNDYSSKQSEAGRMSLHALMTVFKPTFESGSVNLIVENKLQAEVLENEKLDIIQHIKDKLSIPAFEMKVIIEKDPSAIPGKRPYTATEKFNKMVEKNPMLLEFKNRLSLELDF